jgi:hypothetical protein
MITGVHIGLKNGLVFALKIEAASVAQATKGLVCGVNNIPFAFNILRFCHDGTQSLFPPKN